MDSDFVKFVQCRCDCGTERAVRVNNLIYGNSKSCGHTNADFLRNNRFNRKKKIEINPGDRFGHWTAISKDYRDPNHSSYLVKCRCDCGTEKEVHKQHLVEHRSTSCNKCYKSRGDKVNKVNIGDRFGRWTVIDNTITVKNGIKYVKCKCDCGNVKDVNKNALTEVKSLSCGCTNGNYSPFIQDINIGDRFGRWTIMSKEFKKDGSNKWFIHCKCDCGTERDVMKYSLTEGRSVSCGCIKGKIEEVHTGDRFGQWTVISETFKDYANNKVASCKCDCGAVRDVRIFSLVKGLSTSCGCGRNY